MAQVVAGLPTARNANGTPAGTAYGVGEGLVVVGCGVALDEGAKLPKPVTPCCRAAVPRPLRTASPMAAWSNVIGPSDSAT